MQQKSPLELFVPGRVCLFGEHSDWAGEYRTADPTIPTGEAIVCGTNTGVYARVAPHDRLLQLRSVVDDGTLHQTKISIDIDTLRQTAQAGGYWSYIAGVAYQIRQKFAVGGLRIDNYKTDLPVKKGLSSSAAICVLTARAFNRIYNLGLSIEQEMEYAYLGEISTPSQCGRMDQGCAFGAVPIQMSFDGDDLRVQPLAIGADIYLVIVDLCASKDTRRILGDLRACFLDADTEMGYRLRKLLGEINHSIIGEAVACLQAGDARALGGLMCRAQAEFDRYAQPACPTQLTAPVLHRLLADQRVAALSFGGKGIGSQGDGSAQFVARSQQDQQALIALIEQEFEMQALGLLIKATKNEEN